MWTFAERGDRGLPPRSFRRRRADRWVNEARNGGIRGVARRASVMTQRLPARLQVTGTSIVTAHCHLPPAAARANPEAAGRRPGR